MSEIRMSMCELNRDNSTAIPITKEAINDTNRNSELTYGIDDAPPWYLCLFMALQLFNLISLNK
ncbi:hypothetical protein G5I_00939 [Acromyrmex echinatior]|uniref:Uncharacterized protein n=1 Tax=Acromyrmex echinatior TaxID=103372 RepID=F4W646_ACREC|nr:hypothetical protein G5I_00939 [Acromyrmex echinatior]